MIYDTPFKTDDGMRHVRAYTDEKKKCFVQLTDVKVLEVDGEDISFELSGDDNIAKVEAVHLTNIQSALENSKEWFGKELTEKTITKAYIKDDVVTAEKIEASRVFNANKELVDIETLSPGVTCSVFVEFSGLWFARSHFGSSWNLVQVKIHEDTKNTEEEPECEVESYPEECMFEDSVSK
jgi:hypothetical protein